MNKRLDLLDRDNFVKKVIRIVDKLSNIRGGCCFAIEGGWGIGKTFVIEEVEEHLKALQSEETGTDKYFIFHYNCWQYDYYEEPSVAIVSAMLASIKRDNSLLDGNLENSIKAGYSVILKELREIARLYIENKIGIDIISLVEELKEIKDKNEDDDHEFNQMFNFSQTIEKVRKKLQEIAEKRTIVLFVDELDRCIPQYAIRVLERLHHIFYGLNNIVIIMSIDRKQLEHSVEEMFGIRRDDLHIDVEKYLKKFIDFSLVLDNGIVNEHYWKKYKRYFDKFEVNRDQDMEEVAYMFPLLFSEIDIRSQEKIMEKADIVHSLVCNEKLDISVLIFEVMYEVLKLWKFNDLKDVAYINDGRYVDIEKQIGKPRTNILRSFSHKADESTTSDDNNEKTRNNLYGRVFWYFAHIFCERQVSYDVKDSYMKVLGNELEVLKRYCELCEIVK